MLDKFKSVLKLCMVCVVSIVLGGCATLSYVGEDYDSNNTQTIKTTEELVFSVYKKTVDNANIKIGITRTAVPEILALYVQVENLSYDTPYSFKVEDLKVSDPNKQLLFLTSSNYLNIWQAQEAQSMSAMGTIGSSITTMTGMNTNYNDYNQSIAQKTSEETSNSTFRRIDEIGSQITKHSIRTFSTISPRKSQYFYFFFEDTDNYPIKVLYKDLEYQFKL